MSSIEVYSAYLPYGVDIEFEVSDVSPNSPQEKRIKKVTPESISFCIKYGKLILRPLSDLTKKIEHNREIFVPIEELSKDFVDEIEFIEDGVAMWQIGSPHGVIDYSYQIDIEKFFNDDEPMIFEKLTIDGKQDANPMPYFRYNQLIKWHFDVFGLIEKGKAIDINTFNIQETKNRLKC